MYSASHRSSKEQKVFNLQKTTRETDSSQQADNDDFQDAKVNRNGPLRHPSTRPMTPKDNRSWRHDHAARSNATPLLHRPTSSLRNYVSTLESRARDTTLILPKRQRASRPDSPPLILPHNNTLTLPKRQTQLDPSSPPKRHCQAAGDTLVAPQHQPPAQQLNRKTDSTPPLSTAVEVPHNSAQQCPFCHETLVPPFSSMLQSALSRALASQRDQPPSSPVELGPIQAFVRPRLKRREEPVPSRERDAFCRLHTVELVVKRQGEANGYPTDIDFSSLRSRIQRFRKQLEEVIVGKLPSTYRDLALKAYDTMGSHRARSTMGVLTRFETTLPGYYGAKGAAVILDCLSKMFLQTDFLTQEMTAPQLPLEYLQQVLVPETGFRLIREDILRQHKTTQPTLTVYFDLTKRAKDLMKESSEFGSLMYPDADEGDDSRWHADDLSGSTESALSDSNPSIIMLDDDD